MIAINEIRSNLCRLKIPEGFGIPIQRAASSEVFQVAVKVIKKLAIYFVVAAIVVNYWHVILIGSSIYLSAAAYSTGLAGVQKTISSIIDYVRRHKFSRSISNPVLVQPSQRFKLSKELLPATTMLLPTPKESFEKKLDLMRSAKQTIEISFNFAGGDALRTVLGILEERAAAGVTIHLILSPDFLENDHRESLKKLYETYEDFYYLVTDRLYTTKNGFHSEENHTKFMIVDRERFIMGSSGCSDAMTHNPGDDVAQGTRFVDSLVDPVFQELDLYGEGEEVAQQMQDQYFLLYNLWSKKMGKTFDPNRKEGIIPEKRQQASIDFLDAEMIKTADTSARVRFIVSGPEHRGQNPITQQYVDMISSAKKTIHIGNLFFNPDPAILEALEKKLDSSEVEIKGVFNGSGGEHCFHHYLYTGPSRPNYYALEKAYEYNIPKVLYHRKVMVVDNKVIIGSYNLSQKSAYHDHEVAMVIESEEIANQTRHLLETDMRDSLPGEADSCTQQTSRFAAGFFFRYCMSTTFG